jgi:hypothetical protein
MIDRKTYTAGDFKGREGHKVLIEGAIHRAEISGYGNVVVWFPRADSAHPTYAYVSPSAIREILPQEIGAGDKVEVCDWGVGTVVAVVEGQAWVKSAAWNTIRRLSDLTLIEPAR